MAAQTVQDKIIKAIGRQDIVLASALISSSSADELSVAVNSTNVLMAASAFDNVGLIDICIEKGVHVDLQADTDKMSPLMVAVNDASQGAIKALLWHGASMSHRDLEGKTAMHWVLGCITPEMPSIIKMMLDAGGDWETRSNDVKTVRDIARRSSTKALTMYSDVVDTIDSAEIAYVLHLGRRFFNRERRPAWNMGRLIWSIIPATSRQKKREAVINHITSGGLIHDLFIELTTMI